MKRARVPLIAALLAALLAPVGALATESSPMASPQDSAKPSTLPSPNALPSAKPTSKPVAPKPSAKKRVSAKQELPQILIEVEANYEKSPTLSAHFSQLTKSTTGTQKKTSGTVELKRPNKYRWEVRSPDPSLSVSNGVKFWHYTPPFDEEDRGQVIIRRASEVQTQLASSLLSGSFSAIKEKIKTEGANKFSLVPRRGTAGTVKRARFEVNPDTKMIFKVTVEHAGGNRTDITLSDIQLGKTLSDDHFNFKIPANTDQADP